MKKKHLLIAAVVTMPLLGAGEALAGDRYDRETFYYGLSKDGYRVIIAHSDDDRRYYRERRPVRYVTYKRHNHHHHYHGHYHGKKHKHARNDNHHGHNKRHH